MGGRGSFWKWTAAALVTTGTGLALWSPAAAAPGAADDPENDGGAGIDIRRVTHDDTATEIIYTVESFDDFPDDIENEIEWSLDLDNGAFDDAFAFITLGEPTGPTGGFRCGNAGEDIAGTVTLKPTGSATSTAANSVELRFPRSALSGCGAGASYSYIVATNNTGEPAVTDDEVPDDFEEGDGITHTLTAIPAATTTSTTKAGATTTTRPFRDRDCDDFNTQRQAQLFFENQGAVQDPHNLDEDGDGVACEELVGGGRGARAASDPEIAATGTETPIRLVLGLIFLDAGFLAICVAGYRRSLFLAG